MRDSDEEIREIKREIVESRNLTIKTNNLVSTLGAEIKSIAKRQTGYERRLTLNSAVTYAIVALLCFFGLKIASDARLDQINAEADTLRARVQELENRLAEETHRASERATATRQAAAFYELIRQQRRADVVREYDAVAKLPISTAEAGFFKDSVERFRLDLAMENYRKGLELAGMGKHEDALKSFERALEWRQDGAHVAELRMARARSLNTLGRCPEAMVEAEWVTRQKSDEGVIPDAWWLIAKCAQKGGDLDGARQALKNLINKWPRSSYARDARPLLRDLTRQAIHGNKTE